MEIIKKTILQAITTGVTSGCTGHCHVIIPDINAVYYLKFGLVQDVEDVGFLSAFVFNDEISNYNNNGIYNNTNDAFGIGEELLLIFYENDDY